MKLFNRMLKYLLLGVVFVLFCGLRFQLSLWGLFYFSNFFIYDYIGSS